MQDHGGKVLLFPDVASAEVSDAWVVGILLDGDARAPRIVWQKFAPMVHRMLKRAFGPDYEIDDLVQEVFLVLFRRVHTLREPQALKAFVISITAHTIRYELRRKAARRWLHLSDCSAAPASDADFDSREALTRFYGILDRLNSDERTAFVLRFIDGLELVEISQALGVSVATTKRRLAHAWRRVVAHARRDDALAGFVPHLELGGVA